MYRGAQDILVSVLKIIHISGEVMCVSHVVWGCHGYSSFRAYTLNVIT